MDYFERNYSVVSKKLNTPSKFRVWKGKTEHGRK